MDHIITVFVILIYAYTLLSIISVLLLENRNPAKSLSWVLVLLFIPVVGMVFYVLLGQNFRKKKIITKKSIRRIPHRPLPQSDFSSLDISRYTPTHVNLIKLLYENSEADGFSSNSIEILSTGKDTFDAVFKAIKSAKDHIHIEFFIFDDDRISNQLRELLINKAKEGVEVRMIYDYWGSFDLSNKYLKSLRDAGVSVASFLPFKFRFWFSSSKINYRNHRKIIVVDGKIGFTGGLNIADRYIYGNKLGQWRDTFVSVDGPAVHGLQQLFLTDWFFVERKLITHKKYFPSAKKSESNLIQIVSSGPDGDWESIMQGIASALMSATNYIYIQSPYFMPNDLIANCIHIAALSGVDIRLMIPYHSDSKLSDACTFSYLGKVLEAGVKVYRYKNGFLHSKAIVIDDFISIIGSCNIDERSFVHNFEVNAFIYESSTANKLKELFNKDMEQCEELTLENWNNRKRRQKLKESFARLFSPLM